MNNPIEGMELQLEEDRIRKRYTPFLASITWCKSCSLLDAGRVMTF